MSLLLLERRCAGLDASDLQTCEGLHLAPPAARAFGQLQEAARKEGFDLRGASAYRSFERQRAIWNGKLRGERPVLDDGDRVVDLAALPPAQRILRVLRFSALPGTSRHHWGTDVDVFDAAALPAGYQLQLSAAEVAPAGPFGPFHAWLDRRIAEGRSFGFYRPYDRDRGGVAPERWHLSFAPAAQALEARVTADFLRRVWEEGERATAPGPGNDEGLEAAKTAASVNPFLELRATLEADLEAIVERFVQRVARPPAAALEFRPA